MKEFDILSLTRDNVKKLKPYSSARDEFKGDASVYLDANENPNKTGYNRYPDPHQIPLKEQISAIKEISSDHVFLGNGSDEAIDLLIRAFCRPGIDNIIIPEPTYGMYAISAAINDIEVRKPLLTPDFDLDPDRIEQSWNSDSKILFLCSPNNPSGNLLNEDHVAHLINSFPGLVVVDEAYIDFAGTPGFVKRIPSFPNLIILQTFSKAWGLAGIRLGMCFANPGIIRVLDKIKPPYNISQVTQSVAHQRLQRQDEMKKWVQQIKNERTILKTALEPLTIIQCIYPSDANFLLVRVTDAKRTYHELVLQGIIVRDRSSVILCDRCLRITVGTREENEILINTLKKL